MIKIKPKGKTLRITCRSFYDIASTKVLLRQLTMGILSILPSIRVFSDPQETIDEDTILQTNNADEGK